MIRAYWNALRTGDEVVVHDDADPTFAIARGTVAFVARRSATNDVTIRITDGHGPNRLRRPTRFAVHLASRESAGDCWRCDQLRSSAP